MICPKCKEEVSESRKGLDYQLKCSCGFELPWYVRRLNSELHITQDELDKYWESIK